jgi:hypothetical protein
MGVECDIDELTHQAYLVFEKAMEDIDGWTIGSDRFCFKYDPLKMELFLFPSYVRNEGRVNIFIDGVSFYGFTNEQNKKAANFYRNLEGNRIKKLMERECKKMQDALAGVKVLGVVSESTSEPSKGDTIRIPWYKRWFN